MIGGLLKMDKYNLFISINYKSTDNTEVIGKTRVNNLHTNSSKYLICGGIYNRKGGNVVFTAKNLEEVKQVTKEKPLLKDIPMKYSVAFIPKEI